MSNLYGLTAQQVGILFPFHFVIDRKFKIVQIGSSISGKFDNNIGIDSYMDDFF